MNTPAKIYINGEFIGEGTIELPEFPETKKFYKHSETGDIVYENNFLILENDIIEKVSKDRCTPENIFGFISAHNITFIPRGSISVSDYIFLLLNSKLKGFKIPKQCIYKMWKP